MENRDDKTPETGTNADLGKAQSAQQPTGEFKQAEAGQPQPAETSQAGEAGQQPQPPETGQSGQSGDPAGQGEQSDYVGQSEALTEQKSDIEGSSQTSSPTGEAQAGFVGSDGASDTSSELVEDEDYAKDGQGAPEGK